MPVVWMVEEDKRGRWRQFPDNLARGVEARYQAWLTEGSQAHFWHSYTWLVGGQPVDYEISFTRPMQQVKRGRWENNVATMEQVQREKDGRCPGGGHAKVQEEGGG